VISPIWYNYFLHGEEENTMRLVESFFKVFQSGP